MSVNTGEISPELSLNIKAWLVWSGEISPRSWDLDLDESIKWPYVFFLENLNAISEPKYHSTFITHPAKFRQD